MKRSAPDVIDRLQQEGLLDYVKPGSVIVSEYSIDGVMDLAVLEALDKRPNFQRGPWHRLHRKGENQTEYRSYRYDNMSLQVVINTDTGEFYSDLDKYSPYEDVVGIVGHLFVEVVPNTLRKWFGRA